MCLISSLMLYYLGTLPYLPPLSAFGVYIMLWTCCLLRGELSTTLLRHQFSYGGFANSALDDNVFGSISDNSYIRRRSSPGPRALTVLSAINRLPGSLIESMW